MTWAIVLMGFFIGLLSGATGIGGGTLLAPFMMFVLRIDPFVSVGTDLFVSFLTKALGSVIHRRADNIDMPALRPLAIAGVVGALAGVGILALLKFNAEVHVAQLELRRVIGIVLCLCAVSIAMSSWVKNAQRRADSAVSVGIVGFFVAAITSITSVGVGSLSVPSLYFLRARLKMPAVVGTSLAYATIVTAVGAAGQVALRDVNYGVAMLLLIGSLPGVALGSMLTTRASAALKPAVVILLAISGVRLVA